MQGSTFSRESDMWALGVTLYVLLCGRHPFDPDAESSDKEIYESVKAGTYATDSYVWKRELSSDAHAFVDRMLCVDPDRRVTASEALTHTWLCDLAGPNSQAHRTAQIEDSRGDFVVASPEPEPGVEGGDVELPGMVHWRVSGRLKQLASSTQARDIPIFSMDAIFASIG